MKITIKPMTEDDIASILSIQSENLRENLTPEQQKEGYLSLPFSEDEFKAFNRDVAVLVARDQDKVVGYCCISSATFNAKFPILNQITPKIPTYKIPGVMQPPKEMTTCIYGPACIAREYRGKQILAQLFSHTKIASKRAGYEYCFSFVATENQRSLAAHLKLPFHQVGKVSFKGNKYVVIGCKL